MNFGEKACEKPAGTLRSGGVPVMSCAEARAFEKEFFARPGAMSVAEAMRAAGTGVGDGVLRECARAERNGVPAGKLSRLLVLAGKGHNGGDAVIAAARIAAARPACRVTLAFFAENADALAPLTRRALEDFLAAVPAEAREVVFLPPTATEPPREIRTFVSEPHVLLDGVFGHSFRPPFPRPTLELLRALADAAPARERVLRFAVDFPSGLCDATGEGEESEACPLPADVTFATGIAKTPALNFPDFAGRVVPVDIGFCASETPRKSLADEDALLRKIFAPRPARCDKRDFGHVLVVGGSRAMPGALMLNVLAALRAGAGLVSVVCPESVQPAFAARAPGAMWIPCRGNAEGGLDSAAAFAEVEKLFPRVSAVLCGSGMGVSEDSQELVRKIASRAPKEIPLVLDADALRPFALDALRERGAPPENAILLPHAGEFARLCGGKAFSSPCDFCRRYGATLALKGVPTRVFDGEAETFVSTGSPALARGGSGDVLAGTVAALFAAEKNYAAGVPARERLAAAVAWHGAAARRLAEAQGERCADVSALPEFLNAARV